MKIYLYLWPLRKKVQFCPTMKKTLKIQCTFLPHLLFWYCSNLPHGLHHFFISVQPHSTGRAIDFFFLTLWKKLFFSCNFLGYLGPKTHFKQLFFLWFSKSNLFFLSRVQRSGAEHWWWERCAPWKMVGQIWTLEIVKKKY